jgi:cytochrome c peroxidase
MVREIGNVCFFVRLRCSLRSGKPWRAASIVAAFLTSSQPAFGSDVAASFNVHVQVRHAFGTDDLRFDDVSMRTGATGAGSNTVSVTRLAYLVSNARLINPAGARRESQTVSYINPSDERTSFDIAGVEPGDYAGLSFEIGVRPERNHADPALLAADDTLNPQVCGLHWGWQGGYVFFAIEGRYVRPADALGGYSFHVGTDDRLMRVELRHPIHIEADSIVDIDFDIAKVFSGVHEIRITGKSGDESTHSAPGDEIAVHLAANIARSFAFVRSASATAQGVPPDISMRPLPDGTTARILEVPLHFPKPLLPRDNPLTNEGVELGERLFFERALSAGNAQSCSSCHKPQSAFVDPGKELSLGVDGQAGRRNSMPLFNLAWSKAMTWDGKRVKIRDQALAPIQDEREMHQSLEQTVKKLAANESYTRSFARAFGSPGVTPERIGLALEQYMLTLVSADSKFDRVEAGKAVFTAEEQRGLELFNSEFDPAKGKFGADCFHCHGGSLFSDHAFHNNGLDGDLADDETHDLGRGAVTGKRSDQGKFKTPTLRNVAVTGPYMHDGRLRTLEEVISHYSDHVKASETLDPNIAKHPKSGLTLSAGDKAAIAAFLRTLTDERWKESPE